ncbi:PIN domain-containing protein [Desulfonema magnum]|uniref:PIN domain-containing protein n=1 Tax=Desulfonema magnum TaxID=45655 RepID=A0A975GQH0_9BACT|nr:PIN domain-containing protein [Desulfonema magnum]QTA90041.1 PIN domain-containing protein [Desulfonema magnum]
MKILPDTSVLVAAMVESHPIHSKALPWLEKVKNKNYIGVVAAHSLAELYAILTTLPIQPRISPPAARQLIRYNILDSFEVVSLSVEDYAAIIEHLSDLGIVGGMIYDAALILHTAFKVNIDKVVTLNKESFLSVYPDLAGKIVSP